MTDPSDRTPVATRVVLLVTVGITASVFGAIAFGVVDVSAAEDITPVLWALTVMFVLRVAGQVLVAVRAPGWLPPMEQWNLLPYPILLPIQLVFIAAMAWIDVAFGRGEGVPVRGGHDFGVFLIVFSALYATSMLIRYVVRMHRRPRERWFGGTIPIVFHLVLATYLYAIGSFYVAD